MLSESEQDALLRPRARTLDTVVWTPGDVPLLDEARALLGAPRRRTPDDDESPRTFGHIVVDEAQELSPMQLRMLGRRSLSSSMTIVGDVAQATGQWAARSWDDVLAHLPASRGARVAELTVNYRTPAEIMDLAGRVLRAAVPDLAPPEAVRTTGVHPRIVAAPPGGLASAAARLTREEAAVVSGETSAGGRVALIGPPSMLDELSSALREEGVRYGTAEVGGLDDTVTILPVEAAKGLEFDSVVVVEPARMADESAQGLRSLYVALTRATRRLAIVHAEPLPAPLRG